MAVVHGIIRAVLVLIVKWSTKLTSFTAQDVPRYMGLPQVSTRPNLLNDWGHLTMCAVKRKSNRATTAIDYNALHNGSSAPIKNPVDGKLHPYVEIIRNRTFTFAD